jgi:hypothetical protein
MVDPTKIVPGVTVWQAVSSPRRLTRACSICRGHKIVWVCNIEHDEFQVECEACGKGYEGPTGAEEYYEYGPMAKGLVVKSITRVEYSKTGDGAIEELSFSVEGEPSYSTFNHTYVYATPREALTEATRRVDEKMLEDRRRARSRQYYSAKNAAWQARYHTDNIKDLERQLVYHRGKVEELKRAPEPRRKKSKAITILTERES